METAVSPRPDVSIVLVTRNGSATLPALLDAVAAQETALSVEIVAVDSGSDDGTAELLAARVDRLERIAPEQFDHGLTRNLGVAGSRGDLVVLLVQDAVPASPRWLTELVAPLVADSRLAGAFCRHLPTADASRLARASMRRFVTDGERPRRFELASPGALDAMTPRERLEVCSFDDVASCLRRSVWERIPFRPAAIAEDVAWAREVLLAGQGIAYVPTAAVIHCHDRTARSELDRTRLLHRQLHALLGLRTIPTLPALLVSIASTLVAHLRCLATGEGPRPGPGAVARGVALAFAWPLGQYLGGRDGASIGRRQSP
jgi:rhamnosyltransferase